MALSMCFIACVVYVAMLPELTRHERIVYGAVLLALYVVLGLWA